MADENKPSEPRERGTNRPSPLGKAKTEVKGIVENKGKEYSLWTFVLAFIAIIAGASMVAGGVEGGGLVAAAGVQVLLSAIFFRFAETWRNRAANEADIDQKDRLLKHAKYAWWLAILFIIGAMIAFVMGLIFAFSDSAFEDWWNGFKPAGMPDWLWDLLGGFLLNPLFWLGLIALAIIAPALARIGRAVAGGGRTKRKPKVEPSGTAGVAPPGGGGGGLPGGGAGAAGGGGNITPVNPVPEIPPTTPTQTPPLDLSIPNTPTPVPPGRILKRIPLLPLKTASIVGASYAGYKALKIGGKVAIKSITVLSDKAGKAIVGMRGTKASLKVSELLVKKPNGQLVRIKFRPKAAKSPTGNYIKVSKVSAEDAKALTTAKEVQLIDANGNVIKETAYKASDIIKVGKNKALAAGKGEGMRAAGTSGGKTIDIPEGKIAEFIRKDGTKVYAKANKNGSFERLGNDILGDVKVPKGTIGEGSVDDIVGMADDLGEDMAKALGTKPAIETTVHVTDEGLEAAIKGLKLPKAIKSISAGLNESGSMVARNASERLLVKDIDSLKLASKPFEKLKVGDQFNVLNKALSENSITPKQFNQFTGRRVNVDIIKKGKGFDAKRVGEVGDETLTKITMSDDAVLIAQDTQLSAAENAKVATKKMPTSWSTKIGESRLIKPIATKWAGFNTGYANFLGKSKIGRGVLSGVEKNWSVGSRTVSGATVIGMGWMAFDLLSLGGALAANGQAKSAIARYNGLASQRETLAAAAEKAHQEYESSWGDYAAAVPGFNALVERYNAADEAGKQALATQLDAANTQITTLFNNVSTKYALAEATNQLATAQIADIDSQLAETAKYANFKVAETQAFDTISPTNLLLASPKMFTDTYNTALYKATANLHNMTAAERRDSENYVKNQWAQEGWWGAVKNAYVFDVGKTATNVLEGVVGILSNGKPAENQISSSAVIQAQQTLSPYAPPAGGSYTTIGSGSLGSYRMPGQFGYGAEYQCPKCLRTVIGYGSSNYACKNCGTTMRRVK